MKVICAGYIKTGTKSMREALEILGYENVHDVAEQFVYDKDILWKALVENSVTEEDLKAAYRGTEGLMNLPGFLIWKQLMNAFPEAKLVLTVRDTPEMWLKSFKNLVKVEEQFFIIRHHSFIKKLCFNKIFRNLCPYMYSSSCLRTESYHRMVNCPPDFKGVNYEEAKQRYMDHNASVIAECPKNRLLIFNASEGWDPLCKFLEKDIPDTPFPKLNVGHNLAQDIRDKKYVYHAGIERILLREIGLVISLYLCFFVLFVAVLLQKVC